MAVPCGGLPPSFHCSVLACYTELKHTYGTYKAFMPGCLANGGKLMFVAKLKVTLTLWEFVSWLVKSNLSKFVVK